MNKADPRNSSPLTRAGYGLFCVYLAIAFLLRNHGTFVDEGSNLNLASCVLRGLHLYRDLFENHFPLPVYLSAGLIVFTGTSLPLVRLTVLILDAAAFWAVMRVSRLAFPVGFAAAAWVFISPYYFGNMLLYDNLAMMAGIALGAVSFAALARGLEASWGVFIVVTVSGFVAVMSNPLFGLTAVIATGALLFAPRIPRMFVVKAGITIAIPVAAYVIYLAGSGALRPLYSYVVVFNTTTYQKYTPIHILPIIGRQLLLFDIFNPNWVSSWDPLRFNPIPFTPVFDHWVFSGLFYRTAALLACLLFIFRRNYRTAVFLYLFVAALPLREDDRFHAAPFVLVCLFLTGVLVEESLSLAWPWKAVFLTVWAFPVLVLTLSGARYVARHALQSDFEGLLTEAGLIREAARNHADTRLAHYPSGNYMYYLSGLRPLSKFVDFYPWVAEIGRPEVDAELARASDVVLVMETAGDVWTYPNSVTLQSELAYARRNMIREKVGWLTAYVSPALVVPGRVATELPFRALAAPLGDARVEISGAWTKDGYDPAAGGPAVPGPVFGTFSRGTFSKTAANAGKMRLGPFRLNGNGEIAIPIVAGSDHRNLSVVIREAESGRVLASLDPPPAHATWFAWSPRLPVDPGRIEIIAEAKGAWMALGWPHYLRKPFRPGLFRNGVWQLASDIDNVQAPDTRVCHFGGQPDDVPVTGDWDGSGTSKIGVYRASLGQWVLDDNGNGVFDAGDKTFHFGEPGDLPVTGDWDGSGKTKIGIYRPSTGEWLLDYDGDGVFNPSRDRKYKFGGGAGDRPVAGDWTGTGASRIGIVRPDYRWVLDTNGNGQFDEGRDITFSFGGIPGDIPIAGDWNGDGRSKPGIFRRGSSWLFDMDGNYRFEADKDLVFGFGNPGDVPITGAW